MELAVSSFLSGGNRSLLGRLQVEIGVQRLINQHGTHSRERNQQEGADHPGSGQQRTQVRVLGGLDDGSRHRQTPGAWVLLAEALPIYHVHPALERDR